VYTAHGIALRPAVVSSVVQAVNQSRIFRLVQVITSLQDPLEMGNNLPPARTCADDLSLCVAFDRNVVGKQRLMND